MFCFMLATRAISPTLATMMYERSRVVVAGNSNFGHFVTNVMSHSKSFQLTSIANLSFRDLDAAARGLDMVRINICGRSQGSQDLTQGSTQSMGMVMALAMAVAMAMAMGMAAAMALAEAAAHGKGHGHGHGRGRGLASNRRRAYLNSRRQALRRGLRRALRRILRPLRRVTGGLASE